MTDTATAPVSIVCDRRRELRVKIRSLAEEARIIRSEERRALRSARRTLTTLGVAYLDRDSAVLQHLALSGDTAVQAAKDKIEMLTSQRASLLYSYRSLHSHRIGDVRSEARHSQLAYAFIRGKTYRSVEPETISVPNMFGGISVAKLHRLVANFGDRGPKFSKEHITDWLSASANA